MGICKKRAWKTGSRLYRGTAILVLCIYVLGGFMCLNCVGSLQEPMMKHLNINTAEFSLMYSVNSWPNIILCFFSGYFIDRLSGVKTSAVIFPAVTVLGHFIFSFGIISGKFWLTIIGRFIFGMGLEVQLICLLFYVVMWFRGKELSMFVCLVVSLNLLGTFIVYGLANRLYTTLIEHITALKAVGITCYIAGIFATTSIGMGLIMRCLSPNETENQTKDSNPNSDNLIMKKVKFREIFSFPMIFWLLVIEQCTVSSIYVLIPFSQGIFVKNFGMSLEAANNVTIFFSLLGAAFSPLIGFTMDKVGRNIYFLIFGLLVALTGHLILALSDITPYVGICFISFAFVILTNCTSPLIALIIPEDQLGTAIALMMSLMNATLSINFIVAGLIIDKYNFVCLEILFISWVLIGLAAAAVVFFYDRRIKGLLNLNPTQRQLLQQRKFLSYVRGTPHVLCANTEQL